MSQWRTALLLILILATAGVARFAHINRYCYFFDEAWNDEVSTGRGSLHIRLPNNVLIANLAKPTSLVGALPWWRIWTNMDNVTHPPLYIIVLRWWRDCFGESPIISRACSATLSALAVLLLFDVGRILHGTATGLWASLIMALAGAQIELAQEVRPYALLTLISLGALSALVRIEKYGPTLRRNIALGLLVLGMVLTHYFSAPAALAIGVYVLLRLRGRARRDAMISLVLAAIVYAVIWGPFFLQQRGTFAATADIWLREPPEGHIVRGLVRLAALPMRYLMEPPSGAFPLGYVASIGLVLPFLLLRRRPDLLLWCLWLCGTTFFVTVMDMVRSTHHLEYMRYSLLGSPALYMVLPAMFNASSSFVARRPWIGHVIPATVALSCLCAMPEAWEQPKPEFRLLASYLDNNIQPGDAVVFYSSESDGAFASALYIDAAYYSRAYPWDFVTMTHPPEPSLVDQLRKYHSVWFVMNSGHMSSAQLIPGATVDGYQYFPFACSCERITPDVTTNPLRPIVQPNSLNALR